MKVQPIGIARYGAIVVLTGAGVSVASGLQPYRGPGGLWEEAGAAELVTAKSWISQPDRLWAYFSGARIRAGEVAPNAAHFALAELEARLRGHSTFTLITQNIDGLHQRAGSVSVIEYHGALRRTRCSSVTCNLEPFEDASAPPAAPRCARCGALLRPDVVLFDEPPPPEAEWKAKRALRDCDLFLAVGTSGSVSPASNFVRSAEYAGARTVFINLTPLNPANPYFKEEVNGPAEDVLPILLA